jgi:hypothetical protein
MGNAYSILVGKPEGRDHMEDQGIDGRIIFEWIFGKLWTGFFWIRTGTSSELL